jgi:two-component system, NarL family, sensor kinase
VPAVDWRGPPQPETEAAQESERLVAWLRLPAIALIAAGQRIDHPDPAEGAFAVALVLFAAWGAAYLAWLYIRPISERLALAATAIDVAAITALAALSGGPFSQARLAYVLVPVAVAFRFRPSVTAVAGAGSIAAYLGQGFAHPSASQPEATRFVLVQAGYLAWVAAAALLLSAILRRRTDRALQLAGERERLMVEAVSAEERERRALAEALHDTAIQNLLSARHELQEVEAAYASPALARADAALEDTVGRLREAVFDLHPYVLEAAGLEAALTTVAERAARSGRFELRLDARPVGRSEHEPLLLSAARELLTNVARHADARQVSLLLAEQDGNIVISIRDDGQGFDEDVLEDRLASGHVGLASHRARLESIGGALRVDSSIGRGTRAEIRVPLT